MTFIPVNFDDAVEAKPAPTGEYSLQITECKLTETGQNSKRPGSPQFRVSLGFTDEPNTPNVTHFISLPHEEDEPSAAQYKALLLKRFLTAFSIPFDSNGIDTEKMAMDMVGASARIGVELTEPDDNGNIYNRLKVPRLRSESSGTGRGAPPRR